jgi:hypothetical protein
LLTSRSVSSACRFIRIIARTLHQQYVFQSLEDSSSVWGNVECKLRRVNIRRVSNPRRVFWLAFRVTGISDDWYRSPMGVIVISLGIRRSAGENFGCTWKCQRTNTEITNKQWEMQRFVQIFIRRTVRVSWDSPDVHMQSISLNPVYNAWIIVHYQFWIILATIFFNTEFTALLHHGTKETGKWFKHKSRHTDTITRLNSRKISIKHGVDVIHYFSHLIRANEAGTHYWSTVPRSYRRSVYLLIIRTWQVVEIELQWRSARFVISNKGVMRC